MPVYWVTWWRMFWINYYYDNVEISINGRQHFRSLCCCCWCCCLCCMVWMRLGFRCWWRYALLIVRYAISNPRKRSKIIYKGVFYIPKTAKTQWKINLFSPKKKRLSYFYLLQKTRQRYNFFLIRQKSAVYIYIPLIVIKM